MSTRGFKITFFGQKQGPVRGSSLEYIGIVWAEILLQIQWRRFLIWMSLVGWSYERSRGIFFSGRAWGIPCVPEDVAIMRQAAIDHKWKSVTLRMEMMLAAEEWCQSELVHLGEEDGGEVVLVERGAEARRKRTEERARQPGHITPSAALIQSQVWRNEVQNRVFFLTCHWHKQSLTCSHCQRPTSVDRWSLEGFPRPAARKDSSWRKSESWSKARLTWFMKKRKRAIAVARSSGATTSTMTVKRIANLWYKFSSSQYGYHLHMQKCQRPGFSEEVVADEGSHGKGGF